MSAQKLASNAASNQRAGHPGSGRREAAWGEVTDSLDSSWATWPIPPMMATIRIQEVVK